MAELFQVQSRRTNSIFIDANEMILTFKPIYDIDKFINMYKYPEMYDTTEIFKFDEIQRIQFQNGFMKFKGGQKANETNVNIDDIQFKLAEDLPKFMLALDKIRNLKVAHKKETKLKSIYRSSGFFISVFGLLFIALAWRDNIATGSIERRLAVTSLKTIFERLGTPLSLTLGIIVIFIGCYLMWKKTTSRDTVISYENIQG